MMDYPAPGAVWRHDKSGHDYVVIVVANKETINQEKFSATVVYQNEEEEVFSRPLSEWLERFTFLGAAPFWSRFNNPCILKAKPHEVLFVLRAQDCYADALVDLWADRLAGKRGRDHEKVVSARAIAASMRAHPNRKIPD